MIKPQLRRRRTASRIHIRLLNTKEVASTPSTLELAPRSSLIHRTLKCERGQGLVEYLLMVALIAVGTMGVVRALSFTINAKFATVGAQISGGNANRSYQGEADFSQYARSKKDMGNFFEGAASEKNRNK